MFIFVCTFYMNALNGWKLRTTYIYIYGYTQNHMGNIAMTAHIGCKNIFKPLKKQITKKFIPLQLLCQHWFFFNKNNKISHCQQFGKSNMNTRASLNCTVTYLLLKFLTSEFSKVGSYGKNAIWLTVKKSKKCEITTKKNFAELLKVHKCSIL